MVEKKLGGAGLRGQSAGETALGKRCGADLPGLHRET